MGESKTKPGMTEAQRQQARTICQEAMQEAFARIDGGFEEHGLKASPAHAAKVAATVMVGFAVGLMEAHGVAKWEAERRLSKMLADNFAEYGQAAPLAH